MAIARHEYKIGLNHADYVVLRDRFKWALRRDPHAGPSGEYRVRSLYFDTPGDEALREKIDGLDNRDKFRIRRYLAAAPPAAGGGQGALPGGGGQAVGAAKAGGGGQAPPHGERVVLEKKSKRRGMCYKQQAALTRAEAERVIALDVAWMAGDDRPLVLELYDAMTCKLLRPKTIVEYTREPFVHPAGNLRVTFDRGLRTGLFSKDFFDDGLPTLPAGERGVLMEVKYDQFLPDFAARLFALPGHMPAANSKYALCRAYG